MKIAIIGAGNVGGALGRRWAGAGHEILFGARDPASAKTLEVVAACSGHARAMSPAEAAAGAEVVVLAVWWPVVQAVVDSMGDLAGKIIIDCTNPLDENLQLIHGHHSSGGEMIADLAEGARVVKAFNTVTWEVMADPDFGGEPATMFFCGGDSAAAEVVGQLIRDMGMEPCHVGGLEMCRYLEPLAMIWILEFRIRRQSGDYAFRLLKREPGEAANGR
ncbi:MAG: NAD(P)-binding domain-containing protein [Gammaproteobacteria bacterium]|jgi:hypothetical protein